MNNKLLNMKVKIIIVFLCLHLGILNVNGQDDATDNPYPGIDPFLPPLEADPVIEQYSDQPIPDIILDEITTEEIPDDNESDNKYNDNVEETDQVDIVDENKIEEINGEDKLYRGRTKYSSNGPDEFGFSYSIGDNDEHTRDEKVTIERGAKSVDGENEDEDDKITATGSYSFISADGFQYTVNYIADGNGYRPQVLVSKV